MKPIVVVFLVASIVGCKGDDRYTREARRVTDAFAKANPVFAKTMPLYDAIGKAAAAQDVAAMPPPDLGQPALDFRARIGNVGARTPNPEHNAHWILLDEFDPGFQVPARQSPFLHFERRSAKAWLATPPTLSAGAPDLKFAADMLVDQVESAAASLANVDVLVVVKILERRAPAMAAKEFTPGHMRTAAMFYRVADAKFLGGLVVESRVEETMIEGRSFTERGAEEHAQDNLERALDKSALTALAKQLSTRTKVSVDPE